MSLITRSQVGSTLLEYSSRVRSFRPNARLYLFNVIIAGAAMGVFRLLFNFYVLSLGFDEALLGKLVTTNNLTSLLVALPAGYLADQLGRKVSLLMTGNCRHGAVAQYRRFLCHQCAFRTGAESGRGHDGPVLDGKQR